jgi:hypothetical protein
VETGPVGTGPVGAGWLSEQLQRRIAAVLNEITVLAGHPLIPKTFLPTLRDIYPAVQPPSIDRFAPVICLAASEQR